MFELKRGLKQIDDEKQGAKMEEYPFNHAVSQEKVDVVDLDIQAERELIGNPEDEQAAMNCVYAPPEFLEKLIK